MLIKDVLLEGKKRLLNLHGSKGFPEAMANAAACLDAEVLLGFALGVSREDLLRDSVSGEVSETEQKVFLKYCDEVASGRPVAHVTGSKEFYGLDFFVDERVLVPRPETEMIVDEVLGWLEARGVEDQEREVRLLDVGTGSLNIATAIVKGYGHVFAHAVDVSESALEVARMNRQNHGLETHVQVYQSDLLESVEERDFDVIVANLPYIGEVRNRNLADSVGKFEPSEALFGGHDGLELYKKLIQQILEKKMEFDLFVGEFGHGQAKAMRGLLSKFFEQGDSGKSGDFGYEWEIKNDLAGIPRIFVVKRVGV